MPVVCCVSGVYIGRTDQESFLRALLGGVGGALVGLIVVIVAYAMFRQATRAYFAHPLGLHFSQVTTLRLLVAFLCLGFGAGFALRMQTLRRREVLKPQHKHFGMGRLNTMETTRRLKELTKGCTPSSVMGQC